MYYLTDSTITPINAATDNSQGRIIESDSLSDFYLHEISGKHRRKKQHHHKTKAALDSDEEGKTGCNNVDVLLDVCLTSQSVCSKFLPFLFQNITTSAMKTSEIFTKNYELSVKNSRYSDV